MKVLLAEAPYSYGINNIIIPKYFPLGLGYIASVLKSKGFEVELLAGLSLWDFLSSFAKELTNFQPRVVGISAMTPSYPAAIRMARVAKEAVGAITVLGGNHATVCKDELIRQSEIDYVVCGEGEFTMLELCQSLEQGRLGEKEISGLIHKVGGEIRITRPRPLYDHLDQIPFPARELVDLRRFGVHSYIDFGQRKGISASMITSRGCPFRCIYCSNSTTMGRRYRWHSPEYVISEIEMLRDKYGTRHIVFEDDVFTMNSERVQELCARFKERNIRVTWYAISRVDAINDKLAIEMESSGCRMIAFGIESGNQEVLNKIKKGITLEQSRRAVAACHKAGIKTQTTFILGFPFENIKTMEDTLKFAIELSPTVAIFFPLTPYPGTEVWEYVKEEDRPKSFNEWERYVVTGREPPVSLVEGLSPRQISGLTNYFHKRFYLRPKQIARIIRSCRSPQDMWNLGKAGIAMVLKTIAK